MNAAFIKYHHKMNHKPCLIPFSCLQFQEKRLLPYECSRKSMSISVANRNIFSAGELTVREAIPGEYWEIGDLHTAAFFPGASSLIKPVLVIDRVIALLAFWGLQKQKYKKVCVVAVEGVEHELEAAKDLPDFPLFRVIHGLSQLGWPVFIDKKYEMNVGRKGVVGAVTVDNFADLIPPKEPGRRRRHKIAYIASLAVRVSRRRRGIAKRLLTDVENTARSWGCTSIALHCDKRCTEVFDLYRNRGYRVLRKPPGADWPEPWVPEADLVFMMRTLHEHEKKNQ